MNTLYLTADEKKVFGDLSASLQEGWQIQIETLSFEDTDEKRAARLMLVRVDDPKLLVLREKVAHSSSQDEMVKMIKDADLSDVADDDLSELFFAVGPSVLTRYIAQLVRGSKTDKELEDLLAFTTIRHSLFKAFSQS